MCVWEHGLSSIGGQLVLSKKKPGPTAMPVPRVDNGPEPVGPDGSLVPNLPAPGLGSGQDLGLGPAQGAGEAPLFTNVDGDDHLSDYVPSSGNASMRSPVPSLSTDQPSPSSPPVAMQADSESAQAGSAPTLEENPRPAKAARSGPFPCGAGAKTITSRGTSGALTDPPPGRVGLIFAIFNNEASIQTILRTSAITECLDFA